MARTPTGMHPEDIRAEIKKKFGTLAALSRHLKMNDSAVSNAIGQPGWSVPVERKIAEVLGRAPQDIWPSRYHGDGSPVSPRDVRIHARGKSDGLRANGAAA